MCHSRVTPDVIASVQSGRQHFRCCGSVGVFTHLAVLRLMSENPTPDVSAGGATTRPLRWVRAGSACGRRHGPTATHADKAESPHLEDGRASVGYGQMR